MSDDSRALAETEFVALDLETTGLVAIACRIVEFGAVRFRLDGRELACYQELVDPQCPIPWDATRVHRITDAMVRGKPTVADALPGFLQFLGGPETVLVAHNAEFDLGFLALAIARQGLPVPPHRVVDTLNLARVCLPGLYSHGLERLAVRLRLAPREDHRALADAALCKSLFLRLADAGSPLRTVAELFAVTRPLRFPDCGARPAGLPAECELLDVAIHQRRTVVMIYEGGTKGSVLRRVTPRTIVQSGGRPYLAAFCHADGIEKMYRLDRIREVRLEER